MNYYNFFFVLGIVFLTKLLIYYCKKYSFLINSSGSPHQLLTSSKTVPLLGGVIFLLFVLFMSYEISWIFKIALFLVFMTGIFSDLKILNSPTLRIVIQFVIIFCFLHFAQIYLTETRLKFLDYFLKFKYFNLFFLSFCILIIVNGTNLIDGNNLVVIGYYLIITFVLLNLKLNGYIFLYHEQLLILILALLVLFFFNLFTKIFLGDSGAYLISFFYSIILVHLYLENNLSPYFIILLLWYPGFENLFSIIRKVFIKKSPTKPDNGHLHQLIYLFLIKNTPLPKLFLNSLVGILINIYNFLCFFISLNKIQNAFFIITIIIINVVIYCLVYFKLSKLNK